MCLSLAGGQKSRSRQKRLSRELVSELVFEMVFQLVFEIVVKLVFEIVFLELVFQQAGAIWETGPVGRSGPSWFAGACNRGTRVSQPAVNLRAN